MKEKKLSITKYILYSVYFMFAAIFLFSMWRLPQWFYNVEANYAIEVQEKIEIVIIHNKTADIKSTLKAIEEEYSFEVAVFYDNVSIYQTIPNLGFADLQDLLSTDAVLVETKGKLQNIENKELLVWYSIYHPNLTYYLKNIVILQLVIILVCFVFLMILLNIFYRSLNKPINKLKENINKLENYEFNFEQKDGTKQDVLNEQITNFAADLHHRLNSISANYTSLEYALQEEKERLANLLLVIKGLVHDLKTPLHQVIIEQDLLVNSSDVSVEAKITSENTISKTTEVMEQINNVLDILKTDMRNTLDEKVTFDVVVMFKEIRRSLNVYRQQKALSIDTEMEDSAVVTLNKSAVYLILHNMLSNAIKYALDDSEIIFTLDQTKQELQIIIENETTPTNIERIEKSENLLFNFEEDLAAKEHEFSSGNGIYLIKQLANSLGGSYQLIIKDNNFSIAVKIPVNGSDNI